MRNKLGLIWPRKINNPGIFLYVMNSQRSQPGVIAKSRIMFFKKTEGRPPYLVFIHFALLSIVNSFYMEFSTYAKAKIV
jgi:hypothetical protein